MNLFLRSKKRVKTGRFDEKKHNFHFKHAKIRYKNNIEICFYAFFIRNLKILDFRKVYDAFFESSKDWKDENDQNRNVIPLKNVFIWRLGETFWARAYLEFDKNPIVEPFSSIFSNVWADYIENDNCQWSKISKISQN